jgi:hypothetical protein
MSIDSGLRPSLGSRSSLERLVASDLDRRAEVKRLFLARVIAFRRIPIHCLGEGSLFVCFLFIRRPQLSLD